MYDAATGLAVLAGRTRGAVLVDVTLCVDERAHAWASERLAPVVVVGRVERCKVRHASSERAVH